MAGCVALEDESVMNYCPMGCVNIGYGFRWDSFCYRQQPMTFEGKSGNWGGGGMCAGQLTKKKAFAEQARKGAVLRGLGRDIE
jgi:hypothetical protein